MKRSPEVSIAQGPVVIRDDEAYGVLEFRRRTGLSAAAYRSCRREGLPVRRIGKRMFILGSDWLNHLRRPETIKAFVAAQPADIEA